MKKLVLATVFAAGGVFAVQVNDLAPDFDNTVQDDGFWDTTGHALVEVAEGESDDTLFGSLDSVSCGLGSGSISVFDSREKTSGESDALLRFSSRPVGTIINLR
jgi:hypothetical protein